MNDNSRYYWKRILRPIYNPIIRQAKQLKMYFRSINKFGMVIATKLLILSNSQKSKKKLVKIKIPGIKSKIFLRRGTSDIIVFQQIFVDDEYGYDNRLNPEYILDCGAYTGMSSLYFLNKYPKAIVISVEPQKDNFFLLKKNLEGYKNSIQINSAIWDKESYLKVIKADGRREWGFEVKPCEKHESGSFLATSINEIIKRYNLPKIDILKMDIEGAEKQVFSAEKTEWIKITNLLFVELHDRHVAGCEETVKKVAIKNGFELSQKGENLVLKKNEK